MSKVSDDSFEITSYLAEKSEEPLKISKIVNGMQQVSGAHGYNPKLKDAVKDMRKYSGFIITIIPTSIIILSEEGYTTFDVADIYGPAGNNNNNNNNIYHQKYIEEFVGEYNSQFKNNKDQFLTKWVKL